MGDNVGDCVGLGAQPVPVQVMEMVADGVGDETIDVTVTVILPSSGTVHD